jgi:hypothetical protein
MTLTTIDVLAFGAVTIGPVILALFMLRDN